MIMENQDDKTLLYRIDERTQILMSNDVDLKKDIQALSEIMRQSRKDLERRFVSRDEFIPVKNLVYGLTGLILVSVFGSIITLVLTRAH